VRDFIGQAIKRIDKLDKEQIHRLVFDMKEDNQILEMVLGSLDRGIIVTDKQNKITLVNKHIRRFIPLKSGNLQDKIIWEIIEDPQISLFIQQVLINQDHIRERHFTLDMLGRTVMISLSLLPLVKDGRVRGNLLFAEDITQKKIEETRLRRAESLISLTTLTAGIAHEIKNPLGSIAIYLQLMEKVLNRQCKECNGELLGYIEILNEEVERLNSIVVDYLFAVKPLDTNLEPSDLNHVIEELVEFVHYELEQDGIQLHIDLAESLPALALDDKLMKQVLLNLVKNGSAAIDGKGDIYISTFQEGENVCLTIKDNGTGIPEEERSKIFEPYFTTKDNGTGLGLTLVFKIIKEHEGDIEVSSRIGQGTTFKIFLPVPQREQRLLTWEERKHDI